MFQKATRSLAKARIGLAGPSGSGKTYSALLIAQGLINSNDGKIALIDTEHGSGSLYSHLCDYDTAILTAPFEPDKYIKTIKEAEAAGYEIIIIDSLTHAWQGTGGVLEIHDKISAHTRNSFTAWREVTPMHNRLVEAMLQSSAHIIATMRSKVAYEMIKNDKGKVEPIKIGLAPIQREGMDYEFTTVLDLAIEQHTAKTSKDRTSLFDGKYFTPTIETGKLFRDWLSQAAPAAQTQTATQATQAPQKPLTPEDSQQLLEHLYSKISTIDNFPHLKNWWEKYSREIKTLLPEDKAKLVKIKNDMRNQFAEKREAK